jgi:hypothetical protein
MSDKKLPRVKLVLGSTKGKPVRFSYLNVFEPRLNDESGKMEYGVTALIPKENTEDIAAVKQAIKDLQKATWLDNKLAIPPKFWNPLRDGDVDTKNDGRAFGEECKGCYVLNCKSGEDKNGKLTAPQVVNTTKDDKGKFMRLSSSDIQSGDWGRISVNIGSYVKGTGGVGAYLSSVQLLTKGEPLSGQSSAEDDFGGFEDQEDDGLLD